MWNLIKTLFRYSWKNKVSLIALTTFTFISTGCFSSLMILSQNLSESYDYLVNNGNLNNATVHELYSPVVKNDNPNTPEIETELTGEAAKEYNKKEFLTKLDELIGSKAYRRFKSIDYNNSSDGVIYKLIETNENYTIDKLVMYSGHNILSLKYNFSDIISKAEWFRDLWVVSNKNKELTNDIPIERIQQIILNRRLFISILARMKWSDEDKINQILDIKNTNNQLQQVIDINNPEGDPKESSFVNKSLKEQLGKWLIDENNDANNRVIDKQFRLSVQYVTSGIPIVGYLDNFTSYSVVVPDYVLETQNKKIMPNDLYQEYLSYSNSDTLSQIDFETWFKDKNFDEYKIKIDNIEFFITGTGISPGFMYPVFDFAHITPNVNSEVITYGNIGAFNMVWDSNRSAPVDDYLLLKLNGNINKQINDIRYLSKEYMAWPSNINSTYGVYDTSNTLSPISLRVSFLPQLIQMQIGLSNSISIFICIVVGIIFIFIVKKFIYDNKDSLAILRANGFKKRWIIWSTPILSLIPSFVGGLIGYLFAQFTQTLFLGLYSSYWIIPTITTAFNIPIFFIVMLLPFLLMSSISVIFSYLEFRKNTRELMSESSRFKIKPLAKLVNLSIKKASIMTRFKSSIAFSSVSKLFMITLMFSLFGIASSFSIGLTGKIDYIKHATFTNKKYNFAIDMITPTVQGGSYIAQDYKDLGKIAINDKKEIINFNQSMIDSNYEKIRGQGKTKTYYNEDLTINQSLYDSLVYNNNKVTQTGYRSLVHLPSISDVKWQEEQLNYLRYKSQLALFLDCNIGVGSLSTNPWNSASGIMPVNVVSMANKVYNNFWTKVLNDNNIYFIDDSFIDQYSSLPKYNQIKQNFINKPLNEIFISYGYLLNIDTLPNGNERWNSTNEIYRLWRQEGNDQVRYIVDVNKISSAFSLPIEYTILMNFLINQENYINDTYFITYQTAIIEKNDETYTSVNANLEIDNKTYSTKIRGIKPNSKYIINVDDQGNELNSRLLLSKNLEERYANNIHSLYDDNNFTNQDNFKMIINQSAAYQFNLKLGSKIIVDPTEEATRLNPRNQIKSNNVIDYSEYNNKKFTFEIVGITNTYQNPEFYINQRIANYINAMHLKPILDGSYYNYYVFDPITNRDIEIIPIQIDPWNGIFSANEENYNLSKNTILYSESGLAPPFDKFTFNNSKIVLEKTMSSSINDLSNQSKQSLYISKIDLAKSLGYVDKSTLLPTKQTMNNFESDFPYLTNKQLTIEEQQKNMQTIKNLFDAIINIYGESPMLSSVSNAEYVTMFSQIFDNVSHFIQSILIVVLVIIFAITTLTIVLLAIDFISTSISLCAILKALGFYDKTNAFNFMSMFFPAIILSLVISIPISIFAFDAFKKFIYSFSTILIPLTYNWWFAFAQLITLLIILSIVIGFTIWKLKRQNLTQSISGF